MRSGTHVANVILLANARAGEAPANKTVAAVNVVLYRPVAQLGVVRFVGYIATHQTMTCTVAMKSKSFNLDTVGGQDVVGSPSTNSDQQTQKQL